ncbi:ArsR family transcriptional regulator [Candidatus Methanocrinis natronophilus]|uniref:Helix-turn-helix domain-containing protein n=1 Tax=Candidatus Methanocrinis natronophilus TaxID=3033396 RepID=A0ABT5X9N7_9EURY|nr:ArsR family transcriptional regulator [Candidatus Methanocrinis natronophilus]MDF0591421.1 helix-turn-helix domain-containing protein [Candidatus Methanocrinis natronophilus]
MVLDPVEILDILGNENRRRILQLLSCRPFYFSEMAKRLDLGPKAVIDHLEMLERAGLVECYRDDRRRKYFRIRENVVLEVAFSPHSYGVRTYSPDSSPKRAATTSTTSSRSSSVRDDDHSLELEAIYSSLRDLEVERLRLRRLLQEIDSQGTLFRRLAMGLIESAASDQLEAEILSALISGESATEDLARRLGIPPAVAEERLRRLAEEGKVQKRNGTWTI